ncbi:MAG: glycine zipper family protein [Gammaproteobacteria bacterium]
MNRILFSVATASLAAALMSSSEAQQNVFIYPQKGQTQAQQSKDQNECHAWAVQQAGFDPSAPAAAPQPSEGSTGGEGVRGAARGAALGAIGGAIAGDAGKGAAIGAAVGGTGGVLRRGATEREAAEQQAQQAALSEEQLANYKRAVSACLEARGYTVK